MRCLLGSVLALVAITYQYPCKHDVKSWRTEKEGNRNDTNINITKGSWSSTGVYDGRTTILVHDSYNRVTQMQRVGDEEPEAR